MLNPQPKDAFARDKAGIPLLYGEGENDIKPVGNIENVLRTQKGTQLPQATATLTKPGQTSTAPTLPTSTGSTVVTAPQPMKQVVLPKLPERKNDAPAQANFGLAPTSISQTPMALPGLAQNVNPAKITTPTPSPVQSTWKATQSKPINVPAPTPVNPVTTKSTLSVDTINKALGVKPQATPKKPWWQFW